MSRYKCTIPVDTFGICGIAYEVILFEETDHCPTEKELKKGLKDFIAEDLANQISPTSYEQCLECLRHLAGEFPVLEGGERKKKVVVNHPRLGKQFLTVEKITPRPRCNCGCN